jgi:hypothetical protein
MPNIINHQTKTQQIRCHLWDCIRAKRLQIRRGFEFHLGNYISARSCLILGISFGFYLAHLVDISMSEAKHMECRHITMLHSRYVPPRKPQHREGSEIRNPVVSHYNSDDDEFKQPLSDTIGGSGVHGSDMLVGPRIDKPFTTTSLIPPN